MKKFLFKHRGVLTLFLCILLTYGTLFALGISCPIKFLTGISCPGCGMTRATVSALTLRFDMAFYFHPLWPFLIPAVCLMVILKLKNRNVAFGITLGISVSALIVAYIVRLIAGSPIVTFAPENSAIMHLIRRLSGAE